MKFSTALIIVLASAISVPRPSSIEETTTSNSDSPSTNGPQILLEKDVEYVCRRISPSAGAVPNSDNSSQQSDLLRRQLLAIEAEPRPEPTPRRTIDVEDVSISSSDSSDDETEGNQRPIPQNLDRDPPTQPRNTTIVGDICNGIKQCFKEICFCCIAETIAANVRSARILADLSSSRNRQ